MTDESSNTSESLEHDADKTTRNVVAKKNNFFIQCGVWVALLKKTQYYFLQAYCAPDIR
jgi:hypothetical protein